MNQLPNLEDIAPELSGSKAFSILDVSSSFGQLPLMSAEDSGQASPPAVRVYS